MFGKTLLVAIAVMFSTSACYVTSEDPYYDDTYVPLYPGDVNFTWQFDGRECYSVPDVQSVRIRIPGEFLVNDGIFPCSVYGVSGVSLYDFAPGRYSYRIEALGWGGEVLFEGAGDFMVDGDVHILADLAPMGFATNASSLVTWSFPPNEFANNPSCSQAGVRTVEMRIDGGAPVNYNCEEGRSGSGADTGFLTPGVHAIVLTALSDDGYPFYRFEGNLQIYPRAQSSNHYAMDWAVGGVAVGWQLKKNGAYYSCDGAGVTTVAVNFMDEQGRKVYGNQGDLQPCNASPVAYNFLLPGTYRVFVSGSGMGGGFLSDAQNPIVVTVRPGVFAGPSGSVTVPLFAAN